MSAKVHSFVAYFGLQDLIRSISSFDCFSEVVVELTESENRSREKRCDKGELKVEKMEMRN